MWHVREVVCLRLVASESIYEVRTFELSPK